MAKGRNAEIIRAVEDAWASGKSEGIEQYFADDFLPHSAIPGMPATLGTAKMANQMVMHAFPDRTVTIEDLVEAGDKVVVRCRTKGTNKGGVPWLGIEPNNRPFEIEWMTIYRLKGGKIAESWGVNDTLPLLIQLGAFTPPPMPGS